MTEVPVFTTSNQVLEKLKIGPLIIQTTIKATAIIKSVYWH